MSYSLSVETENKRFPMRPGDPDVFKLSYRIVALRVSERIRRYPVVVTDREAAMLTREGLEDVWALRTYYTVNRAMKDARDILAGKLPPNPHEAENWQMEVEGVSRADGS